MYVQLKYTSGNWLLKSENLHTKSGKTAKLYVNRFFKGVRRIADLKALFIGYEFK